MVDNALSPERTLVHSLNMTFLFSSEIFQQVRVFTYPDNAGTDEALLDQEIWGKLRKTEERVAVSITPLFAHCREQFEKRDSSTLKSLICWARPSATISGMHVPNQWLYYYPELFSGVREHIVGSRHYSMTHTIATTRPVSLTQVVLVARSKRSYDFSVNDHQKVCSSLCSVKILRQYSTVNITLEENDAINQNQSGRDKPLNNLGDLRMATFKVVMTEPTLQGTAVEGYTQFVVLPCPEEDDEQDHMFNGDAISSLESEASIELTNESDVDDLVIGEGFLANGILPSVCESPAPAGFHGEQHNSHDDEYFSVNTLPKFTQRNAPAFVQAEASSFSIWKLVTETKLIEDPESCILITSTDLSRAGLFDGDWVGVVSNNQQSSLRLCRIFAGDGLITSLSGRALASPILLANIHSSQRSPASFPISIRPSLFGSHAPSIPVARTVTVARVASPFSTDRTYQPYFLYALKQYFAGRKRLIKKGDLIVVPLLPELARLVPSRDQENQSSEGKQDSIDESDSFLQSNLPLSSTNAGTVPIFFKVTNLEYDIVDTIEDGGPLDHYAAATLGELGCWVDTHVTRMVQTGVENSWVPDVGAYLGLGWSHLAPVDFFSDLHSKRPPAKLWNLAVAAIQPSAMDYGLQLSVLLKGARGVGKFATIVHVARSLGFHVLEINCFDIIGENDIQTEGTMRARFDKAAACAPCVLVLRHLEALARNVQVLETGKEPSIASALQECISDMSSHWKSTSFPVFVTATTSEHDRVPASVLASFKHEVVFEAPNEFERWEILNSLLHAVSLAPDVSVKNIATQTAAMVASDLVDLVELAKSVALKRALSCPNLGWPVSEKDVYQAGLMLTASDLDIALSAARHSFSESIGAPKIPNVTWDDVGGLASVKSDILDTIQLPLEHPELFTDGIKKRSGVLLYGPPGTGKTLLAKAVATSCSLNFFSVKGPELLNMYIGESEANVRKVFQRARDAKPCVIFFDELDSVAPKRGNHGDSGGVMDRIVSQLLAELDGMADGKSGADVFVIGATNRPDLLDPALLRPGRFDRMLYLGVSDTHGDQFNILQALTRKFRRDPDLDLMDIARQCPFNYTGADFYALCSDAMLKAMSRKAAEIDAKIAELNTLPPPYEHPHPITPQYYLAEMATTAETAVLVSRQDFKEALDELVPSVSKAEMAHYAAVRQRFTNVTIGSDTPSPKNKEKGKGRAIE